MKKYEFTGETMQFEGRTLRRIRYIIDGYMINKGEIGGWIESEHNLPHEGTCYVKNDAKVFGHAKVVGGAYVGDNAIVKDNAQITGLSSVRNNAVVGADTIVSNTSWIGGDSKVYFYAQALDENYGKPNIYGRSFITGNTTIEAIGYIFDSDIEDISLFGRLNIDNQT